MNTTIPVWSFHMSAITANDSVVSFLTQVRAPSEIRDANGNLLGVFTPLSGTKPTRNYTTREVFEYLKSLTTDPARLADLDRHIAAMDARNQECDAR
jgi:hypothetical protein